MIPVTKPYLPSREKLDRYIDGIYERAWLTNNGELVQELTKRLEAYLGVENLLLVANGTLALQIAYRALGISGNSEPTEAITTPFTFIATASSLKWEGIEPIFVDIEPDTWCLDPALIESAITPHTRAIVPVHVFGNACEVEEIDAIAKKHKLKVIYDASHAFGVNYKGESLLRHGDAATLSFHATKLFHTGEGGAIAFKRKEDLERAKKMINFGIVGPEAIEELGINAKMSELSAAIGMANLDGIDIEILKRKTIYKRYIKYLTTYSQDQEIIFQKNRLTETNGAYFPIAFNGADKCKQAELNLSRLGIHTRRYFYPSINTLNVISRQSKTPISEKISNSILCLPCYSTLTKNQQFKVINSLTNLE